MSSEWSDQLPDERKVDLIEQHVRIRTGGTIRDLRVQIEDGTALITGRAPSYYTKQLAEQAMREIGEGRPFINILVVHPER